MTTKIIKKANRPSIRSLAELNALKSKPTETTAETSKEAGVVHGEIIEDTPHDYEAAYQRRDEEATTNFNALQREEIEAEKPIREKPPGGYRIDGKFVSAAVWNAWMDEQEGAYLNEGDDEGAYLNEGDDEDDDSDESETHSDDEDADMEAAETVVEIPESDNDGHVVERETLLSELNELVTICNYSQQVLRRAQSLSLTQLQELVATVRRNSGGSVAVADLLSKTEAQYEALLQEPAVIQKLAMVDAKSTDFIKLAQRYQSIMGGDVVVNGVRHEDYHKLVRALTKHTSVIDAGITELAERIGILVPEKLTLGGEAYPVISGTQINTKVGLYILSLIANNLRVWAEEADNAQKLQRAAQDTTTKYQSALAQKNKELVSKNEEILAARNKHDKATSNVVGYVIMNKDGEYLCLKNEEKPLSMNNLDFTDILQTAIIMRTRTRANDLESRVGDHLDLVLYVKPLAILEPYDG